MTKSHLIPVYVQLAVVLSALLAAVPAEAQPPLCPHVLAWSGPIQTWATGAPWIKVIFADQIPTAQACGAQVFYRPYDTSVGTDDGDLPLNLTGTAFADAVWAKISGMAVKPQAIGYRNEFPWYGSAANRHTSAQFRSYRDRLRALGYTGMVVYGSYGVGWPNSEVWDEPEVADAASCADAIETHEYFDFDVNCMSPWLTFRHRDIAIGAHPTLLGSKPWFIGEFGSDNVCNPSVECDDPLCRQGWLDRGKLSESAYVTQMAAYRAGCHPNVVAVFVFQQGAPGWTNFETINSAPVSNYMKSTWSVSTGTINGCVRVTGGAGISGATVSTNTGGYTTTTDSSGNYTLANVNAGTYTVTASKLGYAPSSTGVTVTAGNFSTADFSLNVRDITPPTISNIVPTPTWVTPDGTVTVTANVTDDKAIAISGIAVVKSTNLLTNPNFESGVTGWTNASTPAYSMDRAYPDPAGAKDGAHWVGASCGYGGGTSSPELRQVVDVVPLSRYFLSVWVNTDGSPNTSSAYLQWKNGTVTGDGQCTTVASVTSNTSGWKRLCAVVMPTGSQLTITLKLGWDCGGFGGGGNFDLAEVRPALIPNSYSGGVATWNNVPVPESGAFLLYARDTSLNVSLAMSPIITVAETPSTIAEAKGYADGSIVHLADKILSAKIGPISWIQEIDRSSGIRFNAGTSAALGSRLAVTGKLLTVDGERTLDEAVALETGPPVLVEPLGLRNGILGGGSLNLNTPGIPGGVGTNNIGLLVTTFGRVTFAGSGFFYVDDGSALDDGSGHAGLRVSAAGLTFPSTGFVKVTGISSCERNGSGRIVRLLRIRNQADIVPF